MLLVGEPVPDVALLAVRVVAVVTDDGRGAAAGPPGGRRGLTAMRERVAARGGVVEAGPVADGGWRVRATIPLEEAS
ncbi:hypothetical protein [Streptomyces sp. NPDC056660]|uniref:hypothetical protein n=1 Tax=Streptomyces sp. NPDC056660 TaxID=3345897 RepID=UPI00369A6637